LGKPGRKRASYQVSESRSLSADAKIIWSLVNKQPQKIDALCESARISERTFYYKRPILEKLKIIKKTENGYALGPYVEAEELVIKTIKRWNKIAFRDPTPIEIADETRISPQKAEALARKTKDKTGWAMPNQGLIESATENLGETLVCAARKRDGTISNFDYEKYPDDPEILEEAERFRKEHPEMLPKLIEDGEDVTWPEEALKYLGINYKPKDRHIATLVVIR